MKVLSMSKYMYHKSLHYYITFCNLAGPDPADIQVLLQVVRLLPQQLLVVPPGLYPLFPKKINNNLYFNRIK
jgi:hypothetical protein